MSSFGSWMNASISAGATDTGEIDLGGLYDYLVLLIPGMDTCKLSLKVAEKTTEQGGSYYELGQDVKTDEESFNRADVWRLGGFRHIKIVASKAQSAARTIRIRGWRT